MAKTGRPPKGDFKGKSSVFTTRIRPDLRAKLDEEAKANGRSLSQEVERRLSDSFSQQERMEDTFGSAENYWLMRVIAIALQDTRVPGRRANDWRTDPVLFDAAVRTVYNFLETLRPEGPPPVLGNKEQVMIDWLTRQMPIAVWKTIKDADANLPFFEGSNNDQTIARLKRELGSLVDRAFDNSLRAMAPTGDWQQRAAEADLRDWPALGERSNEGPQK